MKRLDVGLVDLAWHPGRGGDTVVLLPPQPQSEATVCPDEPGSDTFSPAVTRPIHDARLAAGTGRSGKLAPLCSRARPCPRSRGAAGSGAGQVCAGFCVLYAGNLPTPRIHMAPLQRSAYPAGRSSGVMGCYFGARLMLCTCACTCVCAPTVGMFPWPCVL